MYFGKTITAAVTGAALLAAGLGTAERAKAADTVNFALPSVGMLYLPIYVADVMGYFSEQDIDPEIQVFRQGGGTAMAAVLGGDLDIYVGTPGVALRAATQAEGIRIVGAIMTQYASNVVIQGDIARERGLDASSTVEERLEALRGLNIGVTGAGSGTHQLALYMLTEGGMNPERDATIVFVGGSSELLAAFSRQRIDVFTLSNPTSDRAVAEMDGVLLFNMAAGELTGLKDFLYITLNTSYRWLDADPDRARRTMAAIQRAQQALADPEETLVARDRVHEKYFGNFDKALFDTAWASVLPAYPTTPEINRAQLERVVDFLNTFSERPFEGLDLDAVYTADFIAPAAN